MINKLEMKISACIENEPVVRTAIAAFVSALNPSIDEIIDVKTIVAEAVSNAIIHGYRMDKSKDVFIKAILNNLSLEIIVQDYGEGIENLDDILKGNIKNIQNDVDRAGIGLSIIKTLADDFSIQTAKNVGTKVKIKKIFAGNLEKAV